MANKNIPRKSVRSHLFLEASLREPNLAMQASDPPVISAAFKFDESYIMSRRPTRLSMELLSRSKEKTNSLADSDKRVLDEDALQQKTV